MAEHRIPYVSSRDIVVSTVDGYSLRFTVGEVTEVPNFTSVIQAVTAAGCIPADAESVRIKTTTIDGVTAEEAEARRGALVKAIEALVANANATDFTRDGLPQMRSLEQITGFEKISSAERADAWKEYQASKAE